MSDGTEKPERALPAEREVSLPLTSFVKGGTTTLKWDRERQKAYAESEERRDKQASMFDTVRNPVEGERAAVYNQQMGGLDKPCVIVEHIFRDKSKVQYQVCELNEEVQPTGQVKLVLLMFCPKCIFSLHHHPQDSILRIDPDNRKWELDPRTRGTAWRDPDDGAIYLTAGTVETHEVCHCSGLGCDWSFQLTKSKTAPFLTACHTITGAYAW